MNGIMKHCEYDVYQSKYSCPEKKAVCDVKEEGLIAEDCRASGYSLAAMAGGLLLCLGIILYAILTV